MKDVIFLIPPRWGTWASFIRKFRAHAHINWGDLVATVNIIRTHDIDTPWDLARVPKPRIEPIALTYEKTAIPHIPWQATRCFVCDKPRPGSDDKILSDNDALCVVDMIRAELIENTPCAANDRRLLESWGPPARRTIVGCWSHGAPRLTLTS